MVGHPAVYPSRNSVNPFALSYCCQLPARDLNRCLITKKLSAQQGARGLQHSRAMECYFGSYELPKENGLEKSAVVTFNIPDVGIKFKAPFAAVDHDHGDLAALLALLEFIDGNQKYFSKHTYQIYGNNLKIVNGINRREPMDEKFADLLDKALSYRNKYRFSLEWVPARENPAYDSLLD